MSHYSLDFRLPLMNAAGFLGFAPEPRGRVPLESLGAFITNPISRAPHTPARERGVTLSPGSALLHSGLPNPGLSAAIRKHGSRWGRGPLPVIVHLMTGAPHETAAMVRRLEGLDNVMAVELGLQEEMDERAAADIVRAALGELPIIARVPLGAQHLAAAAMDAGASAVSLGPPGGAPDEEGGPPRGRLYGPEVFPAALAAVGALAGQGLPVIGAGGVYTQDQSAAMLDAGALAIQLDMVLWRGDWDFKRGVQ
ncbi:MAG: hypothetical protein EPO32_06025 [Anaerolineae bacterium]|nr:MAG: hypothetical protein EPO32_06025 [Anaerolineae bacterium]